MPAVSGPSGQEFRSLALRLHPSAPYISYVFVKKHRSKEGEQQTPNAVYVTGIPYGLSSEQLDAIFSCFGVVEQAVLHPTQRSALVVLDGPAAVAALLAACGSGQVLEYHLPQQQPGVPLGLRAWVAAHKALKPGNATLQQQLDDWVASHEAAEEAARRQREASLSEEGWTVVVRSKGRKRAREGPSGGTTVTGGVSLAAATAAAEAAGSKQQPAENFYRFQQRDRRRNELLELRQRFEEDRKRLASLKAARNFKPS